MPDGPGRRGRRARTAGSAHYSYQDARRTAGNTNDYNGKMLRITPIPDARGRRAAGGRHRARRTRSRSRTPRTGPNLFDGTEGDGDQAKPEIYAMGLRNPSRLSIDPETDIPYTAWVGPDAGAPSATQGPSTYENAAQIDRAGNYGWPYCMGNGQAYRDRIADPADRQPSTTARRTRPATSPAARPPAARDGWYDCNNLRNDSPNNTGLVEFPHETGTGDGRGQAAPDEHLVAAAATRQRPERLPGVPARARRRRTRRTTAPTPTQLCPYITNDGMTVMDGPVYRYDDDATDDSRRWPEYWDGRWFLHNNGGPSVKHAPAARSGHRPGRRPADLRRQPARRRSSWDAAYMDSKFGPDGALYVQVYDGFFRAGAERRHLALRLHRRARRRPARRRRAFPIGGNAVALLERGLGRRRPTSGTSATAAGLDRGRTRRTPTPRPAVLHRDADRHLRGRQHGRQARSTVDVIAGRRRRPRRETTATTDPADPNGTRR